MMSVWRAALRSFLLLTLAATGCGSSPLSTDGGTAGRMSGGGGAGGPSSGTAGTSGGGQGGSSGGPGGSSGSAGATGSGAAGTAGTGTGGSKDAGIDGPPARFCNSDVDCVFQPTAGCCGSCLAKTDPVPKPGPVCGIACPIRTAGCACVNHQCGAAPQCLPPNAGICAPCPVGTAPVPGPGGCVTCECAPVDSGVDAPNPPKCPTSFTALAVGATCALDAGTCNYPEGRCRCDSCFNTDGGQGSRWNCRKWDTGGPGCPTKSPPIGSSCTTPGLFCTFGGFCSISVGDDVQCTGGVWQLFPSPVGSCAYPRCGP